jgi:hypothetical protein
MEVRAYYRHKRRRRGIARLHIESGGGGARYPACQVRSLVSIVSSDPLMPAHFQEPHPIGVACKDSLPPIAARGDVIKRLFKLNAQGARHEMSLSRSDPNVKIFRRDPILDVSIVSSDPLMTPVNDKPRRELDSRFARHAFDPA